MRPLRCLFPARSGNPSVLSSVLLVALGRLRAAFPRPPVPLPTSFSVSFSASFSVPLSARPSRAQSVPGAAASLLAPPGAAWRRHSELQTFLRNFHSGVIPYLPAASFLAAPGGAWRRILVGREEQTAAAAGAAAAGAAAAGAGGSALRANRRNADDKEGRRREGGKGASGGRAPERPMV